MNFTYIIIHFRIYPQKLYSGMFTKTRKQVHISQSAKAKGERGSKSSEPEGQMQLMRGKGRRNMIFLWHSPPFQLQFWSVGPAQSQQNSLSPAGHPAGVPWVRLCCSSRHHKVIGRFGTKCSPSVNTGLQRRMRQQPGKNHFANRLPRRISLLKSSVQKFIA